MAGGHPRRLKPGQLPYTHSSARRAHQPAGSCASFASARFVLPAPGQMDGRQVLMVDVPDGQRSYGGTLARRSY
jgi:hypothetical protein